MGTFKGDSEVSKLATADITAFLMGLKETISIENVEKNKAYQALDVDLIVRYRWHKLLYNGLFEIKGDTRDDTGNIFVETISNMTKNTPGWAIYTKAQFVFYYHVNTGELNVINMKKFRSWWKLNEGRFRIGHGTTTFEDKPGESYKSEGGLVPKEVLIRELQMKQIILPNFTKKSKKIIS